MGPEIGIIIITFLTGIVLAYIGFRHQQRLKAFELFLERRESILGAVAAEIERLYQILDELEAGEKSQAKHYGRRAFRGNLILYHRMKGGAFGPTVDALTETFWSVANEPVGAVVPLADPAAWLGRILNCLSAVHAFGHAEMSREMRGLSQSVPRQLADRFSAWRNARGVRKAEVQRLLDEGRG